VPELHIITGSNGAGKSTVGYTYLPDYIQRACTVFDGDKLFLEKQRELLKDRKITPKEARNLANDWLIEYFQQQVDDALNSKNHFAYEGHFSEESSWNIISRFKSSGYSVHLIFFGLKDQDLSQMRVIEPTKSGGHYVQSAEIDRNFEGNLIMLDKHFELSDSLKIIDTSLVEHRILITISRERTSQCVSMSELPHWFTKYLPRIKQRVFHAD
jgi:predicted ABC-type ATPase